MRPTKRGEEGRRVDPFQAPQTALKAPGQFSNRHVLPVGGNLYLVPSLSQILDFFRFSSLYIYVFRFGTCVKSGLS